MKCYSSGEYLFPSLFRRQLNVCNIFHSCRRDCLTHTTCTFEPETAMEECQRISSVIRQASIRSPVYSAVSGAFVIDFIVCRRDCHTILHAQLNRRLRWREAGIMHCYLSGVYPLPSLFRRLWSVCNISSVLPSRLSSHTT